MSTRATYQFKGRERPTTTVYIHHDGYERGAAQFYFLPAIEKAGGYGCSLLEAFIRANEGAEITRSHEAHGDTEYRYTLDLDDLTLKVDARPNYDKWVGAWFGRLEEFVAKNAGVKLRRQGTNRLLTEEMAKAEAEQKAAYAKDYAERFPQYTGNIAGANADAERAAQFLAGFGEKVAA